MAVSVGELYAKLGIETKEFDQGLEKAGSSLEQTGSKAGKIGELLSGVLSTAGGVIVAQFAGNVAGAVGGAFSSVVSNAGTAEQNVRDLAAALGIPMERAEALGDVATRVFGSNWGDSLEDAKDGVQEVAKQLDSLSDADIEKVTGKAFALRDSFGVEIPESVNAARTLMEKFGLTSEQAFDFIAKGYQKGLDSSGDFLDTIGEYSTQFSNGGADAGQFFSVLETGLQGGMLGTDKAADAFKEFRVRIQDGSTLTSDSLKLLGIDSQKLAADMASGQITAADAFQLVTGKLREQTDQNVIMQAGVGLLGTQFEDLGQDGVAAMSMTATSMADLAGATDSLNVKYGSLGAMWEGASRQMQVALMPLGEILLELANAALPYVTAALSGLIEGITAGVGWVQQFGQVISDIGSYFRVVAEDGDYLNDFLTVLPASFEPILIAIGRVIAGFMGWVSSTGSVTDTIGGLVSGFVAQFSSNLQQVLGTGQQVFSSLQSIVQTYLGIITGFISQHGASIVSTFLGAWDVIRAAVDVANRAISSIITTVFGVVAGFLRAHSSEIQALLGQAWSTIQTVIQAATAYIRGVIIPTLTGIASFISAHSAQIRAVLEAAWTVISSVIRGALNIIQRLVTTVMAAVRGDWQGAWSGIQQTLQGAWQTIKGIVEGGTALIKSVLSLAWAAIQATATGAWEAMKGTITSAVEGIKSAAVTAFEGLKNSVSTAMTTLASNVTGAFSGLASGLAGIISGIVSTASSLGAEIINGIVGGIKSGVGALVAAIKQAAADALNAALDYLGISSPSKVMAREVGYPMAQGIAAGITAGSPLVSSSLIDTLASLRATGRDLAAFSGSGAGGNSYHTHFELSVSAQKALETVQAEFEIMRVLAA